ncbi:hypothetical protein DFP88_10431 [Pseudoroseicyclus aestuarii]|uniref:Uncharacterized protein n=1 Tax=Pseudoroseicyclus aestuarii TaxID=1795041 RepID=A0A318SSZ3_9RHOB|nr:hypothetical protein DFP88_10431 [Pseudoroseicyclus aestuarii]
MCGLRRLPIAGPAVEVVENVARRREMAALHARIESVEIEMSNWSIAMRDLVRQTISDAMQELSKPNADGDTLTSVIRELREMNEHGYHAALFEGLFKTSAHYTALMRQPENYGLILDDRSSLPRGTVPILLELDKTRLVALPPASIALLLSSAVGIRSRLIVSEDIWAIPADRKSIWELQPEETYLNPPIKYSCPECNRPCNPPIIDGMDRSIWDCPHCGRLQYNNTTFNHPIFQNWPKPK